MNDSTRVISPLRQRMLEDMRMRKLAPQTQASYVRGVRRLAGYLRRPPDTATVEDLRNFQLHLVDRGTSPITLNATITGLKFFFGVTLDRGGDRCPSDRCARNVSSSDWVCHECALVWLGRGLASAASG